MGTRADFYIGIGPSAEWLGSISYDGDPHRACRRLLRAKSVAGFRRAVEKVLCDDDRLPTIPSDGWPWPWPDSRTTDFAYAWVKRRGLFVSRFGAPWVRKGDRIRSGTEAGVGQMADHEVCDMSKVPRGDILGKSGLLIVHALS